MHLHYTDLTDRNVGSSFRGFLQVNKTINIMKSSMLFKKMANFTENKADLYMIKMLNFQDMIHVSHEKPFCIS